MSKKPIYRFTSHTDSFKDVGESFVPRFTASIRIPDILPLGSTIHIQFQTIGEDGNIIEGGAFYEVARGGVDADGRVIREGSMQCTGT